MATVAYIPDEPTRSCIIGIRITASLPLIEQNALREVLDALIEVTKDLNILAQMYPRVWGLRLTAIGSDGKEMDEPEFFQAINDCPALWERSARYVRNIIGGDHSLFDTEGIAWHDEETETGFFAIRILTRKRLKYVRDLALYLWRIDEEHTCIRFEFIQEVVRYWGIREETLAVLGAAYHTVVAPRGGIREIIQFLKEEGYPQDPETLAEFITNYYVLPHAFFYDSLPFEMEPNQLDDFVTAIFPRGKVKPAKLKEALTSLLKAPFPARNERPGEGLGRGQRG